MEILSPYIIAALAGWIVSQFAKYVVASIKNGRLASYRQLYLSGHMPSAHSATTVAVLVVIGLRDGIGEQGIAITRLIKEQKSKVPLPRVAMGHTPLEVAVGSLLGVVVGGLVFWATSGF